MFVPCYSLSRLDYVLSLIELIWQRMGPTLHLIHATLSNVPNHAPHERLLQALSERDAVAAEAALVEELLEGARSVEPLLAEAHTDAPRDAAGSRWLRNAPQP